MRKLILGVLILSAGLLANDFDNAAKAYDKRDYQKAAKLYQKACDSGDVRGCTMLATLYEEGQGVKKDYQKASKLYQKACDGEVPEACYNLGVMYMQWQDYKKAKDLYAKACDGGNCQGLQ